MFGCSGWSYKGWEQSAIPSRKTFYTNKSNLKEYAQHFNFCEINSTFYKQPTKSAVLKWKATVPDGFKFLVKVNKYLTHAKKLLEWNELFPTFYDVLSNLEETLVGFLVQLPPQFRFNKKNLDRVVDAANFCTINYPNVNFYVEFRHFTWFCDEVYDALKGLWNIVFVNTGYTFSDMMLPGFSPPLENIGKVNKRMFRMHGPWTHQAYCGNYTDEDLVIVASLCDANTIVAFDNTDSYENQIHSPFLSATQVMFEKDSSIIFPSAVANAKRLREIMGIQTVTTLINTLSKRIDRREQLDADINTLSKSIDTDIMTKIDEFDTAITAKIDSIDTDISTKIEGVTKRADQLNDTAKALLSIYKLNNSVRS